MKKIFLAAIFVVPILSACHGESVDPDSVLSYMNVVTSPDGISQEKYLQDKNGYRWICSSNALYIYDGANYIHCINTSDSSSLSASHVNTVITDGDGTIFVATQKGIDSFDHESQSFRHYKVDDSNHYIVDLATGPDGDIYAISRLYLFKLDRQTAIFRKVLNLKPSSVGIHFSKDPDGGIWINYDNESDSISFSDGSAKVARISIPKQQEENANPAISSLDDLKIRDNDYLALTGDICWILREDGNLWEFSYSDNTLLGVFSMDDILGPGHEDITLIKSFGKELLAFSDRIVYRLDVSKEGAPRLSAKYTLPVIRSLGILSPDGSVWVSGSGAAVYCASDSTGDRFVKLTDGFPDKSMDCWSSIVLKDGTLAFGFTDIGLVLVNPVSKEIRRTTLPPEILQMFILGLYEDQSGLIWIATTDNGILTYDRVSGKYGKPEGIKDQFISNIAEDKDGNIYINTPSGVYISKNGKISKLWGNFKEYSRSRFLVQMPDGQVYFSNDGHLIHLNPLSGVTEENPVPPLNLILCLNDNVIRFYNSSDGESYRLRFKTKPEGLYFYLNCLNFDSDRAINYYYKVGNGNWQNPIFSSPVPLYDLGYDANTIQFRAEDAMGSSDEPVMSINIWVRRPPLQYVMSFFILAIIVTSLVLFIQWKKKKDETERIKENMDFFSNISHEFRTPLSLVNGAVDALSSSKDIKGNDERMVGVIKRNSARMLKLVSQMLDIRKIDHNTLPLSVAIGDVSAEMNKIMEMFSVGAEQKSIDLTLYGCEKPIEVCVDMDKIEKMMFNLISNAIKYTPPGGKVNVNVTDDGENLILVVEDTGIGIPQDMIEKVFDLYSRTEKSRKLAGGYGIGLYYTKSLVRIHHGTIKVENRETGGTRFTISLPDRENYYTEKEKQADESTFKTVDNSSNQSEFIVKPVKKSYPDGKPSILIIDDDYEIVHFLKMLLEKDYKVDFRYDAVSGYAQMNKVMPDIVICDVMMVDVDGYQFCRMAKSNDATSHIPIVLLTAKSTMQDQIAGFQEGADAYIVKPFNNEYLQTVLSSILENRRRLQKIYQNSTAVPEKGVDGVPDRNKEFMETLYSYMEESLRQGELDVDTISAKFGYSRTKFFYKLKAIVGQTPNEFFTTYKLNRSLELLKSGKYKISAIAEMMGFNSASHFSGLFKKKFGILPSQYRG